jgi:hypothetical protein
MTNPIQAVSTSSKDPIWEDLAEVQKNCRRIFPSMTIQLKGWGKEEFALYFIHQFFENFESFKMVPKTNEFTITLAEEQKRNLIGPFILHVRKEVKGSFNFDEHKISFEEGSITLDWGWTSGYLHSISKNPQKQDLTIRGKYLGITSDTDFPVDAFVNILEYNLPINPRNQ